MFCRPYCRRDSKAIQGKRKNATAGSLSRQSQWVLHGTLRQCDARVEWVRSEADETDEEDAEGDNSRGTMSEGLVEGDGDGGGAGGEAVDVLNAISTSAVGVSGE